MVKSVSPIKTKYPGVTYIEVTNATGQIEKSFYVTYRDPESKKLKNISCGRSIRDDMTPAKASHIRAELIMGKRKTKKDIQSEKEAKPSIGKIWQIYLEQQITNPRTAITDKGNYKHLASSFGHKLPEELKTLEVDDLRQRLEKEGKSPQTVKHILALLRRIIRFGAKKGLCRLPDSSQLNFELPTVDNVKTEFLDEEHLKKLIAALDNDPDQVRAKLAKLALFTGMRKRALTGLKWDDIDFEKNFIFLRGENAKKGKTEIIPMNDNAKSVLLSITHLDNSSLVFPGSNGQRIVSFESFYQRIRIAADLPDGFRPLHGLRHTFASLLASTGRVDLYTLQKLLTHSSPEMTQRYAHLADAALMSASSNIGRIFDDMDNKTSEDGKG